MDSSVMKIEKSACDHRGVLYDQWDSEDSGASRLVCLLVSRYSLIGSHLVPKLQIQLSPLDYT